jgi:tetrathionate reductase subunit B
MESIVMSKALLIDLTKCYGCQYCVISCRDEHVDNDWTPYAKPQPDTGHMWMKSSYQEKGQYPNVKMSWTPTPCMHCDNAPCIKAATGDAVYKRPDGIVIIDPVKSVGQKQIVASCPYGAVYWNDTLSIPQKCTMCAHLLDRGWTEPRCVQACSTGAITFGEYDDLKKTIDEKGAKTILPENKPRVYYIGLET